jgi:GxxExxY protein
MEPNKVSGAIINAAIKVHTTLGPGLLESAYEACLAHELRKAGLKVETQILLPVIYDGVAIDAAYTIDLLVEDMVIVELKAVEELLPVHEAQLRTYLRLSQKRLGLIINFNVPSLKTGIRRMVKSSSGHSDEGGALK